MARGRSTTKDPPQPALPKVQFVKLEGPDAPAGVHDHQARSFGFNDYSPFQRPDNYIRYIEPLESELATQVEYDMDEQDQAWLDLVNEERKKTEQDKVSCEVFEITMDRVEKEYFDLTKNIPKQDSFDLPSEDSTCAICDDSEGENSNAIVFCDGCNLAVHQDCYGVPYIPEGQWLCRKCDVSPQIPVTCVLCPNEGGAFKQVEASGGKWAHLLCSIWIPETRVANESYMEPIVGVELIPKQRWKLRCSICDIREGACIQCAKSSCFQAFHPTCARKEKLMLPMKSASGLEPVELRAYCDRHLPKEQAEIRSAALEALEDHTDQNSEMLAHSTKFARAHSKAYVPGPPLVPAIILDRIIQYIDRVKMRKKPEFVAMVCRYWSLKREARRGAPLLKRLHLEPWTANQKSGNDTEEQKIAKLEQLRMLRDHLDKINAIADLMRKRETRKLWQAQELQNVLTSALHPHEETLWNAFGKITALDRMSLFKYPVLKAQVPDYTDVVKKPMSWNDIETKLNKHEYWDIKDFKADINLVLENAILYNPDGTPLHKNASRILVSSKPILDELDQLRVSNTGDNVGNLEPPIEVLELLLNSDLIRDDVRSVLDSGPLQELLDFKLEKLKPPPPTPPPPPPEEIPPSRIITIPSSRSRKGKNKSAASGSTSKTSPSQAKKLSEGSPSSLKITVPRATRQSIAAAAAFEAEAEQPPVAVDELAAPVSSKKRKRATSPLPSPDPSAGNEMTARETFKRFDVGWVLPEGHKRGGRKGRDETPSIPPPRKRVRTAEPSNLRSSVLASNATDEPETQKPPETSTASGSSKKVEVLNDEPSVEDIFTDPRTIPVTNDNSIPGNHTAPVADVASSSSEIAPSALLNATNPEALIPSLTEDAIRVHEENDISTPPVDPSADGNVSFDNTIPPAVTDLLAEEAMDLRSPSAGKREPAILAENDNTMMQSEASLIKTPTMTEDVDMADATQHDASITPTDELSVAQQLYPDDILVSGSTPARTQTPHVPSPLHPAATDPPLPTPDDAADKTPASHSLPEASTSIDQTPENSVIPPHSPAASRSNSSPHIPSESPPPPPVPISARTRRTSGRFGTVKLVDKEPLPLQRIITDEDGIVVVEHLDSPATRRKQKKRGKSPVSSSLARAASGTSELTARTSENAGPSMKTEIIEPESIKHGLTLNEKGILEGGTLVFGKLSGFPWWPAVIFEEDSPEVPPHLLTEKWKTWKGKGKRPYKALVRFYDDTKSWQYLTLECLRPLGDDKASDEKLMASQRGKKKNMMQRCRKAYEEAMNELDVDES